MFARIYRHTVLAAFCLGSVYSVPILERDNDASKCLSVLSADPSPTEATFTCAQFLNQRLLTTSTRVYTTGTTTIESTATEWITITPENQETVLVPSPTWFYTVRTVLARIVVEPSPDAVTITSTDWEWSTTVTTSVTDKNNVQATVTATIGDKSQTVDTTSTTTLPAHTSTKYQNVLPSILSAADCNAEAASSACSQFIPLRIGSPYYKTITKTYDDPSIPYKTVYSGTQTITTTFTESTLYLDGPGTESFTQTDLVNSGTETRWTDRVTKTTYMTTTYFKTILVLATETTTVSVPIATITPVVTVAPTSTLTYPEACHPSSIVTGLALDTGNFGDWHLPILVDRVADSMDWPSCCNACYSRAGCVGFWKEGGACELQILDFLEVTNEPAAWITGTCPKGLFQGRYYIYDWEGNAGPGPHGDSGLGPCFGGTFSEL